jgi:hypothetical protein
VIPRKRTIFCSRAFSSAVFGEEGVELLLGLNVVQLPQIEMVGVELLQAGLEEFHRAIVGAVVGFAGEPHFVAAGLHHLSYVLLAPLIRPAVSSRRVDVVDAQVNRAIDEGDRFLFLVGLLDGGLPAQAEDAGPVACFPEIAHGHRKMRARVECGGAGAGSRGLLGGIGYPTPEGQPHGSGDTCLDKCSARSPLAFLFVGVRLFFH